MVLSNEEFNTAEICDIDVEKEQMSSLFQLRQSTHSFLIQCLADREIQKLIYSKTNYSSSKSAYSYNCTVIHNPHAWYHVRNNALFLFKYIYKLAYHLPITVERS
jgi:hypothetical protein